MFGGRGESPERTEFAEGGCAHAQMPRCRHVDRRCIGQFNRFASGQRFLRDQVQPCIECTGLAFEQQLGFDGIGLADAEVHFSVSRDVDSGHAADMVDRLDTDVTDLA
jgi:hypothetical protein